MALPIKLKRSSVPSKVPTTAQLDLGEIAINTYDGILYLKKDDGAEAIITIKEVTENNLSVNTSTFVTSTANTLAEVLSDLDFAIAERQISVQIYTYTLAANTDTISGEDDNARTLIYSSGLESVFIDGVLQTTGTDYTPTDATTITLDEEALTGSVITVISRIPVSAFYSNTTVLEDLSETFSANTSAQVVDVFDATVYRTAKYFIQITDNTNSEYHATELFLIHNGANVFSTEYATVFSNSLLGTVTADFSANTVRVLVAPITANSTIKTQRITLGV